MTSRGWDVQIETAEGLTDSADALLSFADALHANPRALGSATSVNTRRRVLSASFSVLAVDEAEATNVARAAFLEALEKLSIPLPEPAIAHMSVSLEREETLTPAP